MRAAKAGLFCVLAVYAGPVLAAEPLVDAPAGRLEDVAVAVARQTGTSIVIVDRTLATRRIGRLKGRMSGREAAERMAKAAGGRAVALNAFAFRIERAASPVASSAAPPAAPVVRAPPALPPPGVSDVPIVVVASKRDTQLRDYAGQANQIDGEDLSLGGTGGTERIATRLATVATTHLGSGRNKLFIRGIADSSFTGPTQSTVGQYLGDLRLSYNAPDPDLRLSDMRSVEILEGPQGTLYGAGSLGGIVRLVPNDPQLGDFHGSGAVGASITAHGEAGFDGNLIVNVPLVSDRIGFRVAADGERQGGYIDKPLLGLRDVNRTWIGAVRAAMRVRLADEWNFDLIALAQSTTGDDSQYADRHGEPLERSSLVTEGYFADYNHAQAVLSGRIGPIRLRSSTGFARQDLSERYDATPLAGPLQVFVQRNRTRLFANETRLWQPLDNRFGWIVGTSFTRNSTRLRRELESAAATVPTTGVTNRVGEFTLYGEASLRVFDRLIATAGGRLTWATLDGEGEDVAPEIAIAGRAITAARTERTVLPSFSLSYRAHDDATVYLRYQEGFRPGGLTIDNDFVRRFRNDRIASAEFGLRKGQPGRSPYDIAISVSYTDWRDIQADYLDLAGLPTTANVGDGRILTLTVAGGVRPVAGLRLDAGLVVNRSRISQPNLYTALIRDALVPITEVPNVAKVAARLGADYRTAIGHGLDLRALGWLRYVGQSRLGVGPELGDLQGDYLESGATVRIGTDALGGTVSITNIPDTAGNRFSLGTPFAVGRQQITPLRPLTVRIGIDARF